MNIFERVVAWNSARYPQVYNYTLQHSLLREEFVEFITDSGVKKLDALCDVAFVALGGLWKAGTYPQEDPTLDERIYRDFADSSDPVQLFTNYLDNYGANGASNTTGDHYLINTAAYIFADLMMMELFRLDMPRRAVALSIVCDSNDTKAVAKTAPGVKANINKGAGFVPPEARLQALLDTRLEKYDA